jgi:hypothetical protein
MTIGLFPGLLGSKFLAINRKLTASCVILILAGEKKKRGRRRLFLFTHPVDVLEHLFSFHPRQFSR